MRKQCAMTGRRVWLAALLAALALGMAQAQEEPWDCEGRFRCGEENQGYCVVDDLECPEPTVRMEGASVCGCCPGCVVPKDADAPCDPGGVPCKDGYSCKYLRAGKFVCKEGPCTIAASISQSTGSAWTPSCERDGNYSAVQCKENTCFCWSPDGTRLHGFASATDNKMTCACSVAGWYMEKEGRSHDAPRCTDDGSFEDLQCAAGVCWCAETRTGKPQGRVVPHDAMKALPCYDADSVGTSYRRVCDSMLEAVADLDRIYKAHGATRVRLPKVACDLDGGYAPVQTRLEGTQTFCAWKDKSPLYNYFQDSAVAKGMNCKCARDKKYLDNENLPCLPNGNHNPRRVDDCFDDDGFYNFTLANSEERCPNEVVYGRLIPLTQE